jgi:hypothetical protein
MNKGTILTAWCFLLTSFILVSCATTNQKPNLSQSKSSQSSVAANSKKQFSSQNIRSLSSLSELKTPDKIIFYHGGKQKVFTKKDSNFLNIIKLNNQRKIIKDEPGPASLDILKSSISLDEILQSDNVLVYNYDQSKYFPIYFPLNKNERGKYYIAQSEAVGSRVIFNIYGWLSSPEKLLGYLNG